MSPGYLRRDFQQDPTPNVRQAPASGVAIPRPSNSRDRSRNPLRQHRLSELVGQEKAKRLLRRVIYAALERDVALDHVLLVGPSGIGKSTVANVIAHELKVDCFQVQA